MMEFLPSQMYQTKESKGACFKDILPKLSYGMLNWYKCMDVRRNAQSNDSRQWTLREQAGNKFCMVMAEDTNSGVVIRFFTKKELRMCSVSSVGRCCQREPQPASSKALYLQGFYVLCNSFLLKKFNNYLVIICKKLFLYHSQTIFGVKTNKF